MGDLVHVSETPIVTGSREQSKKYRLDHPLEHMRDMNDSLMKKYGIHWRDKYGATPDMETFNAVTGGLLNRFSPTQNARFLYDLFSGKDGKTIVNSYINGNNGIVSDKFAEEHPYLSMAANFAGDAVAFAPFGIKSYKDARNYEKIPKPYKSELDWSPESWFGTR